MALNHGFRRRPSVLGRDMLAGFPPSDNDGEDSRGLGQADRPPPWPDGVLWEMNQPFARNAASLHNHITIYRHHFMYNEHNRDGNQDTAFDSPLLVDTNDPWVEVGNVPIPPGLQAVQYVDDTMLIGMPQNPDPPAQALLALPQGHREEFGIRMRVGWHARHERLTDNVHAMYPPLIPHLNGRLRLHGHPRRRGHRHGRTNAWQCSRQLRM